MFSLVLSMCQTLVSAVDGRQWQAGCVWLCNSQRWCIGRNVRILCKKKLNSGRRTADLLAACRWTDPVNIVQYQDIAIWNATIYQLARWPTIWTLLYTHQHPHITTLKIRTSTPPHFTHGPRERIGQDPIGNFSPGNKLAQERKRCDSYNPNYIPILHLYSAFCIQSVYTYG